LTKIYGTQTAAVHSALAALAKLERRRAAMQEFVEEVERDGGPLTDVELAEAEAMFSWSWTQGRSLM
jgi:hypothetical protein